MKYIRLTRDNNFTASEHHLSSAVARAEAACAYDMDACDAAWLRALNGERAKAGVQALHEEQLERVIEELEVFSLQIVVFFKFIFIFHNLFILDSVLGQDSSNYEVRRRSRH